MGGGLFAVVCKWKDFRSSVVVDGHEAIVVEAADANEAQDAAYAARPDLWEDHGTGFFRETAVHPATRIEATNAQ
jgi:hypothetical protein